MICPKVGSGNIRCLFDPVYEGTASRIGPSWFEPLQTARLKIQRALRLLVRCSSEPGRIVDGIWAKCGQCLFFRDLRWRRCADRAREGGQPYALGCRVAVNDVVDRSE